MVIDDFRLVKAAMAAGATDIAVLVRDDLAADGEAAVVRRLFEANLAVRRLSIIEGLRQFSMLAELSEIKRLKGGKRLLGEVYAATFGLKFPGFTRYLPVLTTPPEVQQAIENGELKIGRGLYVAKQTPLEQEKIANRIAVGGPPAGIVRQHSLFHPPATKGARLWDRFYRFGQRLLETNGAGHELTADQRQLLRPIVAFVVNLTDAESTTSPPAEHSAAGDRTLTRKQLRAAIRSAVYTAEQISQAVRQGVPLSGEQRRKIQVALGKLTLIIGPSSEPPAANSGRKIRLKRPKPASGSVDSIGGGT
jgi:hypothetical protein